MRALPSTTRCHAAEYRRRHRTGGPLDEGQLWGWSREHTRPLFVGNVGDLERKGRTSQIQFNVPQGPGWSGNPLRQDLEPRRYQAGGYPSSWIGPKASPMPTGDGPPNTDVELMQAMVKINDKIPSLRNHAWITAGLLIRRLPAAEV